METQRNNALNQPQLATPSRRFLPLALCIASALALPLSAAPVWATGVNNRSSLQLLQGDSQHSLSQINRVMANINNQQNLGNQAGQSSADVDNVKLVREAMNEHVRMSLKNGQTANIWLQPYGNSMILKSEQGLRPPLFNAGLLAGADMLITDNIRAGVLLGGGLSNQGYNLHVGPYLGGEIANLGLRAGVSYSHIISPKSKDLDGPTQASAAKKEGTWQGFAEASYALLGSGFFTLDPFANLAYIAPKEGVDDGTILGTLGARAAVNFDTGLKLQAKLGWQYNFNNAELSLIPQHTFLGRVELVMPGTETFNVIVGLQGSYGKLSTEGTFAIDAGLDLGFTFAL